MVNSVLNCCGFVRMTERRDLVYAVTRAHTHKHTQGAHLSAFQQRLLSPPVSDTGRTNLHHPPSHFKRAVTQLDKLPVVWPAGSFAEPPDVRDDIAEQPHVVPNKTKHNLCSRNCREVPHMHVRPERSHSIPV